MSTHDDDIELEIEPDAGAETLNGSAGGHETAPGKAADALSADDGIDALKRNLAASQAETEAERGRRQAAERTAAQASEAERTARAEMQDTNLALVSNAIETVKSQAEILKGKLRDAITDGDPVAQAEIHYEISLNASKLNDLEQGKAAMEAAPKPEARKSEPIVDPVEKLAADLSPRSAAWVRAHPEYARDSRKLNSMVGAHNVAIGDGLEADTDAYFARVEGILGISGRDAAADRTDDDALSGASGGTARRSGAPPSPAPPSRGGDGTGSNNRNTVRLTADEREIAKMNGLTDQEYARNKLELQRTGRITSH